MDEMKVTKQKTNVEGVVISISKKEKGLVSLTISEGKSKKEVDFPFAEDGLGLTLLKLALENIKVKYEASQTLYSLTVLDGPSPGQVYRGEIPR